MPVKKKQKKKLVRRKPVPKFRLSDALISELDPDAKYVIAFQGDRDGLTPEMVKAMKEKWEQVMGKDAKAMILAFTEDIQMDIYEVKS